MLAFHYCHDQTCVVVKDKGGRVPSGKSFLGVPSCSTYDQKANIVELFPVFIQMETAKILACSRLVVMSILLLVDK